MPVQSDMRARVGMAKAQDGSEDSVRAGRTLEQIVTDGHGHFHDAAVNKAVFTLTLPLTATGIAAGNIVAAAAAAATQFAVWNPNGSGVNVSLLRFGMGIVSGTWPAGPLFHGIMVTAPSIGSTTAVVANNNYVNGPAPSAKYVATAAQAGTPLTGNSGPVTFSVADFASTATAQATVGAVKAIDLLDGSIVLPPGTGWLPLWSSAGTSVLNGYSLTWEEIPV